MDPKIVGNRIVELRIKKNMTQQQLADILLVSNKTVSKWENGGGLPDITTMPKLAKALSTSIDELLEEDETYSINTEKKTSSQRRKKLSPEQVL